MKLDHISYKFDEGRNNVPQDIRGKCCFVLDEGIDEVKEKFGRDNIGLKVFFTEGTEYWGDPNWAGHSPIRNREIGRINYLSEATIIQNLAWMGGFSSRVYGLIEVERNGKKFPAQVIELVKGEKGGVDILKRLDEMEEYLAQFGALVCHKELIGQHDFIDGKLIDFQGFTFRDNAKEYVINYIREKGRYGKGHYQSVPELGISGKPRNTEDRIKTMGLDEIDFEGKNVLDIGCNSGVFCNYASRRGAKRVFGIDLPDNVKSAQCLAFWLGYFNNDYFSIDLKSEVPSLPKIDITLLLSMVAHIGFPEWIGEVTGELLVMEENAMASKFDTSGWCKKLLKWFNDVKIYGYTRDHNPLFPKPVIWAEKN